MRTDPRLLLKANKAEIQMPFKLPPLLFDDLIMMALWTWSLMKYTE